MMCCMAGWDANHYNPGVISPLQCNLSHHINYSELVHDPTGSNFIHESPHVRVYNVKQERLIYC